MLQQDSLQVLILFCGAPVFFTLFQLVRYRCLYTTSFIPKSTLTACFLTSCFLSPLITLISFFCLSLPISTVRIFSNTLLQAQFLSITPFTFLFSYILQGFLKFVKPMNEYLDILVLPPALDRTLVNLSTSYEKTSPEITQFIDLNGLNSITESPVYRIPAYLIAVVPSIIQQLIEQTIFQVIDTLYSLRLSDFFHYHSMPEEASKGYHDVLEGFQQVVHSVKILDVFETGTVSNNTKQAFYAMTKAIEQVQSDVNISSCVDNETVSPNARHVLDLFSDFIRDFDIAGVIKMLPTNSPQTLFRKFVDSGFEQLPSGIQKFLIEKVIWTMLSCIGLVLIRTILHETCKYLITGLYEYSLQDKEKESKGWYYFACLSGLGFALGEVFPFCCILGILCTMDFIPISIGLGLLGCTLGLIPIHSALQVGLTSILVQSDNVDKRPFWRRYLWSIVIGTISTCLWYGYGLTLILIHTISSSRLSLPMVSLGMLIIPLLAIIWEGRCHPEREEKLHKQYELESLLLVTDIANEILLTEHRKEA